ncbi:YceI family protein [Luteimonas sp. 50]|uniref:YceI family protein n=1 Tax=Cognatiluteimonas sedimenti TaxID=2927791 RepID=A0ABT0A3T6_9GAMM|nr:YceI family protein [Lysobacter sedimenti]MCJ0825605.1 YceI family protein [Lysobacter sedimenti]
MTKRILLASALALAAFGASAEGVSYAIDPSHTVVLATWNHFGYSNPSANFGQASGSIVYDADAPAQSSVQVTLPMSGLASFVPKLDEHLRSADFFDAGKYPAASFRSTSVRDLGEGRLEVTGNLDLHGISKPVVLDVKLNKAAVHPMSKAPTIGFDATATIRRSEFGIAMYVPMVSDEVQLRITTEASAAAPEAK